MTPAPACAGNPWPFDTLIDHAAGLTYRAALREARTICGGCPLRATCLLENREEPWAKAILGRTLGEPVTRPTCGTRTGANAHYRNGESGCDKCRATEAERSRQRKAVTALAANVQTLADIPEVVRVMHAEHVKLKARGEEIPAQVREGERTYQALRHMVRKAKREQVAA